MGVKQRPPVVAVQLRPSVWDTRRRTQRLPTAAERIVLIRDAGSDDHQPPDPFAGGGHGGHEAVRRALSRLGGAARHEMDRMAMGIFMGYVG